jgi:hypothetical protein
MADTIQFPRPPEPADGDAEGPTEVVVRIVLEMPEAPAEELEGEPDDQEPPEKSKVGWGWFWLGALLGLGLGA